VTRSYRTWPIRLRLTVSYVLVLLAIIVLFAGGTSLVLYWQLRTQLFRFAISDIETVEGLLYLGPERTVHFNESYHNHPESRLIPERLLEVLSLDGRVLYSNQRLHDNLLGGSPLPAEGVGGYSPRRIHLRNGAAVLLVSRQHRLDRMPVLIRVGYGEESIRERVNAFLFSALIALPLSLAIAGIPAYQLAKKSLEPVQQMALRAEQITAAELDRRLPTPNPNDELGHLALVINALLDRLQQSFDQLRRFTSDASHELRTPLAAIRSVGEVGLQKGTSVSEYRETIGSMLEEVNRLTQLVDSLLTMSRADAAQVHLRISVFDIGRVLAEIIAVVEVLAGEKHQNVILHAGPPLDVKGDPLLIRQAVLNVLHNAIKYSPEGSVIEVRVSRDDKRVLITVTDNGPGIPFEHRAKVFDRFYRVDPARTRQTGGAGLGLSIARWAARAQGGDITILDSELGAAFLISVPLGPKPPMLG
jgi:heavy metal sensor kinase